MRPKLFLFLCTLATAYHANAAFTVCKYAAEPCNDQGDHFDCQMMGWADRQFCSATDQTTLHPPPQYRLPVDDSDRACLEQCQRTCLQPPVFCGGW